MTKFSETLSIAYKAARYSIAFCLRNNRRDTILEIAISFTQSAVRFLSVLILGNVVSKLQVHLTNHQTTKFSLQDFISGSYFLPVSLFILIIFVEVFLYKLASHIRSRKRRILSFANTNELNAHRATLDVARISSKEYDDLEKKIHELPNGGQNTRIFFAAELTGIGREMFTFMMFAASMMASSPYYVFIILIFSIPMIWAEFIVVNRHWNTSVELVPQHKARGVMLRMYYNTTAFIQGLMFNQHPHLVKQIRSNQKIVIDKHDALSWSNMQLTLATYLISMVGLSIVIVNSVWNTLTIGGDLGILTIIIASSRNLQSSIREIVISIADQWISARGVILIEEELLGTRPMLTTENPVSPVFKSPPRIVYENVCFSYPGEDKLVLRNINLEIRPGEKMVIVGKNGSGKSSLISLLQRHRDPSTGTIRVGDLDLRNILPNTWNRYASTLTQEYLILDRKIGEEIASSDMDRALDNERVRESSQFANFDCVIENDAAGFETQIGTEFGGREFSGGEMQRLALARMHYRDTPIIMLDEPDAKLDAETAQRVIERIFAIKDKTVVLITQHLSRVTMCDRVVMLDKGELVDTGTHQELMVRCEKYANLFAQDSKRSSA